MQQSGRKIGRVKFFSSTKGNCKLNEGFGILIPCKEDEHGKIVDEQDYTGNYRLIAEVFVHFSSIRTSKTFK